MTDLIESLNATTANKKMAWFILGPYVFHPDGGVYYHNSMSNMGKWTPLEDMAADQARKYLRGRMKLAPKKAES